MNQSIPGNGIAYDNTTHSLTILESGYYNLTWSLYSTTEADNSMLRSYLASNGNWSMDRTNYIAIRPGVIHITGHSITQLLQGDVITFILTSQDIDELLNFLPNSTVAWVYAYKMIDLY
jgi:hypothetical protein